MPASGARTIFLEFKILYFATGEPDKVQIWDLVRVVGIVAPFGPRGVGIRGKFVLSSPSLIANFARFICPGKSGARIYLPARTVFRSFDITRLSLSNKIEIKFPF